MVYIVSDKIYQQLYYIDFFACVIAALGHDVSHPGLYDFCSSQYSESLKRIYNDESPLENMHASLVYSILSDFKVLLKFSHEEKLYIKKSLIFLILSTDSSRDFESLGTLRCFRNFKPLNEVCNYDDKIFVMSIALKCADVGLIAKEKDSFLYWTGLLMKEILGLGGPETDIYQFDDKDNIKSSFSKNFQYYITEYGYPLFVEVSEYLEGTLAHCVKNIEENKQIDLVERPTSLSIPNLQS